MPKASAILTQPLDTYTGRIWFHIPVTARADTTGQAVTLTITITTQACDDRRCLPPETTTLRLPLEIGSAASE